MKRDPRWNIRRQTRTAVTVSLCVLACAGAAQTPSLVDSGFDPHYGPNQDVFAIAVQPDGKVLIAGQFTNVGGTNRGHIARLHRDGSLDLSFDPGSGANGDLYAVALQTDGKVLLGGGFTSVNGVTNQYLARLHTNGALDTSFHVGASINNELRVIAVQPDDRIVIGGRFTKVGGQNRGRLARLNADGTLDTAFATGAGADNNVRSLALQTDGRMLIGGTFTNYSGTARARLARLNADGTLDTSFDPGSGAGDQVRAIAVATNGSIYIGGDFAFYNGTNMHALARLFSNGGLDLGFDRGDPDADTVRTIALQPDGRVWIGGQFVHAGGTPRLNVARLNPDGSADASFDPAPSANDEVFALVWQTEGRMLVGGKFTTVDGLNRSRVARLLPSSEVMQLEFTDASFVVHEDLGPAQVSLRRRGWLEGAVMVEFATSNGTARAEADYTAIRATVAFAPLETVQTVSVAILDDPLPEGNETFAVALAAPTGIGVLGAQSNALVTILDNEFQTAVDPTFAAGVNEQVFALAVQPDGRIVVGGQFYYTGSCLSSYTARLMPDGLTDCSFYVFSYAANGPVYSVGVQPDGKILVGGAFTWFNGLNHTHLSRIRPEGWADADFQVSTNLDANVWCLALQPDGRIVIAGEFTHFGATPRPRIARVNSDGSLDSTFNPGTGADQEVFALALQPDGKMLIGGRFTNLAGLPRPHVARLNTDGSLDADFNPGLGPDGTVHGLTVLPNGKILIGGEFTSVNGTNRSLIARLNPDGGLDVDFDAGPITGYEVRAIGLQPDGKVLLGGTFSCVNQVSCNNLARLNAEGALDTGFDLGPGPNGEVRAIQVLPDGSLLVAGAFTQIAGVPRVAIARLVGEPAINRFDLESSALNIEETAGTLNLVVRRSGPSSGTVSVDYATADDTALAGQDYVAQSGTLVFHPLETVQTISIPILNDALPEPTERFVVWLSHPSSGAQLGLSTNTEVSILDRDRGFELSAANIFVREDAGSVTLNVLRQDDGPGAATVDYATSDGSAHMGADYTAQAGTLTFGAGETVKPVTVPILANAVFEGRKTFQLTLSNPSPGTALGPQRMAQLTIEDQDSAFGFGIINEGWEPDGSPMCYIERRGLMRLPASVRLRTSDGTATANLDYLPLDLRLNFAQGETYQTFVVPVLNDGLVESDETLNLSLSEPTGQSILDSYSNAVVTIHDNDRGLEFAETNLFVNQGADPAVLVVRRGDDGTNTLMVRYTTLAGTAQPGRDFVAVSGTLSLPPGSNVITVPLLTSCEVGPDKTFQVVLSDPGPGASLAAATNAVVTLIDPNRAGSLDLSFTAAQVAPWVPIAVSALALQPDGKILLANGYGLNRLESDGRLDTSFMHTVVPVNAAVAQPDGRILIGLIGCFPDAFIVNPVAGLHPDGTWDWGFAPCFVCGSGEAIVPLPDGNVIAAGQLPGCDGPSRVLARLQPDGEIDPAFTAVAGLPSPSVVEAQTDLKVLVGSLDGSPAMLRLQTNGAVDPAFHPQLGYAAPEALDGTVRSLLLQPDGKIVVSGDFKFVNGVPRTRLARLNSDGSLDSIFNRGQGLDASASALAWQPDGKIILGGRFTTVAGAACNQVARLNPDASLDPSFDVGAGPNGSVDKVLVLPDGHLLVAGQFDQFSGVPHQTLVRLNGGAAPARFAPIARLEDDITEVRLEGARCHSYVIDASTDLRGWFPVSTNTPSNGQILFRDTNAAPRRFYRARGLTP